MTRPDEILQLGRLRRGEQLLGWPFLVHLAEMYEHQLRPTSRAKRISWVTRINGGPPESSRRRRHFLHWRWRGVATGPGGPCSRPCKSAGDHAICAPASVGV